MVKGGANLRYFFESPRYSEDIDLDAVGVEPWRLEAKVDQALASPAMGVLLRAGGLAVQSAGKQKQTQTTQWWKPLISVSGRREPVRTRIEFSHQPADLRRVLEAVPDRVVAPYALRAPTVLHYTADAAIEQKIVALARRSETQARDVFDLDLLLRRHGKAIAPGHVAPEALREPWTESSSCRPRRFAIRSSRSSIRGGRALRPVFMGADPELRGRAAHGVGPMRPTEAFGDLLRLGRPIIETREAAVRLGISSARASQLLRSLEEAGLVRRLCRGLWTLRSDLDPVTVPPYLTAPLPAYVSFWSARARHGMIEQVPRQVFVASLDRTRRVTTTAGIYSIHHLAPEVFGGYEGSEERGYVATPEKALFDTVYLQAPRGGRILLPELELPEGFEEEKLEQWTSRIARSRLRTLVSRGLERALAAAARGGPSPISGGDHPAAPR